MTSARSVILIGFKGSGKSTVGAALAEKLEGAFVDTDHLMEEIYREEKGEKLTFREIYLKEGRQAFIDYERQAVEKALEGHYAVIALGGGTIANLAEEIDLSAALVVGLGVNRDVLYERIMADGVPAFFDPDDPRGSFDRFYAERAPGYNTAAAVTVDNSGDDPTLAVAEIIDYRRHMGEDF